MIRALIGVLLIAHGVAHAVGFVVPWRILNDPGMPYHTTIVAGRYDIGDVGIRMVGVVWLLLAIATTFLGVLLFFDRLPHAGAIGILGASLAFCFIGWPEARIGVIVNLVLIALLIARRSF